MKKLMAILMCLAIMIFMGKVAFAEDEDDIMKKHQERMKKVVLNMRSHDTRTGVKNAQSSLPIKNEYIPGTQPQAIDTYGVAIQYLVNSINPDSYTLSGLKLVGPDMLGFIFELPDGFQLTIIVNPITAEVLTGRIGGQSSLKEMLVATREYVASNMNVNIGEVHVNGIEDVSNNHDLFAYKILSRVDNFDISFIYSSQSAYPHIQLLSIMDRATGVDILEKAIDYLSEAMDPNDFPLADWGINTDGSVSFKFALNRQKFDKNDYIIIVTVNPTTGDIHTILPEIKEWIMAANEVMAEFFNADALHIVDIINRDGVTPGGAFLLYIGYDIGGTEIGLRVNRDTGEVYFYTNGDRLIASFALATRQDITMRMGLDDIGRVHISDFRVLEAYAYNYVMDFTATVDHYVLTLEYTSRTNPMPGYTSINLKSFIDNNTGSDYVKEAIGQLVNLFNIDLSESSEFQVSSWTMRDGVLQLNMIGSSRSYSVIIPVTVNLSADQIAIDPAMADLVMTIRNDVSEKLNTDIMDVHINGLQYGYSFEGDHIEWNLNQYRFNILTPQFALTYEHNIGSGVTQLTSCVNNATGVDLYANAVAYLHQNYGEDPNLANWNIATDGISILFDFRLGSGEIIEIGVVIGTGDPQLIQSPEIQNTQDTLIVNLPQSGTNTNPPQSSTPPSENIPNPPDNAGSAEEPQPIGSIAPITEPMPAPVPNPINNGPIGDSASPEPITPVLKQIPIDNGSVMERKAVEAQIELKGNGKNYTVTGQMADAPKEALPIQKKQ